MAWADRCVVCLPNAKLSASTTDSGVVAIAGSFRVFIAGRAATPVTEKYPGEAGRPAALQPLSTLGRPGQACASTQATVAPNPSSPADANKMNHRSIASMPVAFQHMHIQARRPALVPAIVFRTVGLKRLLAATAVARIIAA